MPSRVASKLARLFGGPLPAPELKPAAWVTQAVQGDPLRTRKLRAQADALLDARISRVVRLVRATCMTLGGNFYGSIHGAAGDGGPLSLSPDPALAGEQLQAWFTRTWMQVVLDSEPEQLRPREGELHWVQRLTAQTATTATLQAYQKAKAVGVVSEELESFLSRAKSTNAVDVLANRQYSFLRNMTLDTSRILRDELQNGMRQGLSVQDITDRVVKRTDKITRARARTIVRSEITYAHAEATLNTYQQLGVQNVTVQVEWTLNVHGGADPCPRCKGNAGRVLSIDDARGLLPLHPNCQCGWVPVETKKRKTGKAFVEDFRTELQSLQPALDKLTKERQQSMFAWEKTKDETMRVFRMYERREVSLEQYRETLKQETAAIAKYQRLTKKLDKATQAANQKALQAAGILEKRAAGAADVMSISFNKTWKQKIYGLEKKARASLPLGGSTLKEWDEGRAAFERLMGRTIPDAPRIVVRRLASESRAFHRSAWAKTGDGDQINFIAFYPKSGPSVAAHELGHWLEDADPNALRNSVEFIRRRTIGDTVTATPSHPDEVRLPDQFRSSYTGKIYTRSSQPKVGEKFTAWEDIRSSEVTSMGAQYLVEDAAAFLRSDPEHFAVTVANLKGLPLE